VKEVSLRAVCVCEAHRVRFLTGFLFYVRQADEQEIAPTGDDDDDGGAESEEEKEEKLPSVRTCTCCMLFVQDGAVRVQNVM